MLPHDTCSALTQTREEADQHTALDFPLNIAFKRMATDTQFNISLMLDEE